MGLVKDQIFHVSFLSDPFLYLDGFGENGEFHTVVFHFDHGRAESFIQLIYFHVNEDDDEWKYSSSCFFSPKELKNLRGLKR